MPLLVGVMSGTSMDAVDAVLVTIEDGGVRVLHRHEHAIPADLRRALDDALTTSELHALEAWRLDARVGGLFADAVAALLAAAGVGAGQVTAIGSHGQTLYHAPDDDPAITVQIGDPSVIARRTGIITVADFRRMDVAAGGQGAPLAPLFHRFAFAHGQRTRAILNIGGIANLSVLPEGGGPDLGFDTGPGNTLLDLWCLREQGRPYDRDGEWAAGGSVSEPLLDALLADEYFSRAPPKSTGREHFNAAWLEAILERVPPVPARDVQRTLCELTATSVARALERHAPACSELFVCGGGALNPTLMGALTAALENCRVSDTAALGVPPKAVEGAAFAWLAHERLAGRPVNTPPVTGASQPVKLGGIYEP